MLVQPRAGQHFCSVLRLISQLWPGGSQRVMAGFEKRRHRRFDMTASGSQAALVQWDGPHLKQRYLDLLNLSYGGMCFRSAEHLGSGTVRHYLLDVKGIVEDVVFVKARVQWVKPTDTGEFLCGASFLESSKGWLS